MPPDEDMIRRCGAMKEWLAPSLSSHSRSFQVPGPKDDRSESWDNQGTLAAEDSTAPKCVKLETSPEQSDVVEQRTASGAYDRPGSQRSASTWDVSAVGTETERKCGSIAGGTQGVATPRDAGLGFETATPPLSTGAQTEVDLFGAWFKNLPAPLADASQPSKLNDRASCHHDLDSCTGEFLPAIEQPETLPSAVEGPCQSSMDIAWRHINMSSELQINRELKSRQRLTEHLLASRRESEQAMASATNLAPEENSWPNAHCLLRPVLPEDFSQIANVINLEGTTAALPQMFDSKVVDSTDVDWIYRRCQQTMRPFIVAIPIDADMMDRSKWPPNSERAYQEYVEFKKSRPSPPPPVVGFALVTEARLGFPQFRCPGSRYSGQLKVIVHPEYRKKSYGTALLDRILLSVSPRHRSLIDYEWKCDNAVRIYETPIDQNARQYARLYVEVFCASKEQDEYAWRAEMLGKFSFEEVAHLRDTVKTNQGYQSKWLDLVIWEFAALDLSAIREGPH